jgi:hypothetical protein
METSTVDSWTTCGDRLHQTEVNIQHEGAQRRGRGHFCIIYCSTSNTNPASRFGATPWSTGAAIIRHLQSVPLTAIEIDLVTATERMTGTPPLGHFRLTIQGLQCLLEYFLVLSAAFYRSQLRSRGVLCTEWLPHFPWTALAFFNVDVTKQDMTTDFPC